ncbi:3-isopropylmalate dehydratase large subunit [Mycobacterium tuberculosis]|nr:3-isopropylmalate dehydratase large subunit [Mycobacterium tuberculosis]
MALQTGEPRTLAEKIWDDHIVVSGGAVRPT